MSLATCRPTTTRCAISRRATSQTHSARSRQSGELALPLQQGLRVRELGLDRRRERRCRIRALASRRRWFGERRALEGEQRVNLGEQGVLVVRRVIRWSARRMPRTVVACVAHEANALESRGRGAIRRSKAGVDLASRAPRLVQTSGAGALDASRITSAHLRRDLPPAATRRRASKRLCPLVAPVTKRPATAEARPRLSSPADTFDASTMRAAALALGALAALAAARCVPQSSPVSGR